MPGPKTNMDEIQSGFHPKPFSPSDLNEALPKAAQVYELVRNAIIMMTMQPGAVINEKEICEQLTISRTPLREAILQLHNENLVEVRPNSGTFVTPIDLQHVFDGQLVRDALELKAVRFAARRLDREFNQSLDFNLYQQRTLATDRDFDRFYGVDEAMHQLICEHGSSNRVWRIITGAKAHLDRVRRLAIPEENHLDIVLAEHTAIIDALKAGDEAESVSAMKTHIRRVFQTIQRLLEDRKELFAPDVTNVISRFDDMMD